MFEAEVGGNRRCLRESDGRSGTKGSADWAFSLGVL
jgi:hypothetical protein